MARGLGPAPRILIIVAYVCNYSVNTELCGSNQQDCGGKERKRGARKSRMKIRPRKGTGGGVLSAFWPTVLS